MLKINYNLLMKSLDLPQFNDISELSELIGISESLIYCLSKRTENYYSRTSIPKKDGRPREIYIPSYTLKIVQKWILRNILDKIKPSSRAMAFRKGNEYGCKANALFHIETRYGIALDLNNFFSSIESKRIYEVFSNIGYGNLSATILTNLCTLDGFLPQGGVCSPSLSNLVCLSLDARLIGLCEKRRIRYSRYADDMYFSSDNQDVLKKTIPIIRKIIENEGFSVNERKVHYHTPSNRKNINGVTVSKNFQDDKMQLKANKELKRKIRAEIHQAILSGDYSRRDHIIGEIMYVEYIESDFVKRIKTYINKTANKIQIFPELVEQYNKNLLFKSLDKLEYMPLNNSEQYHMDDEYYEYLYCTYKSRQEYLKKNKLIDICKYSSWPFTSESDCDNTDDILPF